MGDLTLTWTKRDWLLLIMVTALAIVLRFYQLGQTPPGFQFDEAFNAIDAEQVLHGNYPIFLPANGGREVLYTYFQAAIGALFGLNVYTLRLASALLGSAAVAATYLLLRVILRRDSQLVAMFTAIALAISYWHIHFSHYGIRVITMPLLFSACFGAIWVATHAAARRTRLAAFVACGFLTGLSVYANPTGRFAPFVLLVYVLLLLWRDPAQRRWQLDAPLPGLLLSGFVAFIVFLPLGITFYRHPDFFFGHASEVSIFASRVSGDHGPLWLLGQNILHVLGMFTFTGDREWTHGIAGRPVLDWVIGVPFYVGVVIWGARLLRRRDPDFDAFALLALWAAVMLAPSLLSEAAPNTSRTLPSLPATLLPIGLGLTWLATAKPPQLQRRWPRAWLNVGLPALILVGSASLTLYDYFVRFPQMQQTYYAFDVDKLDALAILKQRQQTHQVYLAPLWAEHPPVLFERSGSGIKTLDTADTLVLPPERGALFAFSGEEARRADQLAAVWPGAAVEHLTGRYGLPLISTVTVDQPLLSDWPPSYRPQAALELRFDDGPTLLGMQASPAGPINLFWRGESPTFRNLTTFVHLIDVDGQRVAQADKVPGNGSYMTPSWSPGERVIDRTYPELLDPCAGGDNVRVVVGWYEYLADGARRPRLNAPGDTAVAGTILLPVQQLPPDAAPAAPVKRDFGPLRLLQVVIHDANHLAVDAPFVADLFLQARDDVANLPAQIIYPSAAGDVVLWQGLLAPGAGLQDGKLFCQRIRGRIGQTAAVADGPTTYPLTLAITSTQGVTASVALTAVSIGAATHLTTSPPLTITLDASLAEVILRGVSRLEVAADRSSLAVDLVWRARTAPAYRYKVFVQLLDSAGQLVAQSDALPAGGYPTSWWSAGEVVLDSHALSLDPELPAGDYDLVAGMYDELTLERLPALDDNGLAIANNAIPLTTVTLHDKP